MLENEGLAKAVCRKLGLSNNEPDLSEWTEMLQKERSMSGNVTIALVGKYVELHDAYISVVESLHHAGIHNGVNVDIKWINAEYLTEDNAQTEFMGVDGILVPGGFGDRGLEGKITAIKYARGK